MADQQYLQNRKRYGRPQAMLWSNNLGTLNDGIFIPNGYEVGAAYPDGANASLVDQFIILSDHNRSDLQFTPERIQSRQRMINGSMRSYHIADKLSLSTSWSMLPSRSHKNNPDFNATTGLSDYKNTQDEYTADNGAGGVELLDWYETHTGPFWVFLSYDKYTTFGDKTDPTSYTELANYSQVVQMYFKDFSYSVVKRGRDNFDLWNVSVTLEEA